MDRAGRVPTAPRSRAATVRRSRGEDVPARGRAAVAMGTVPSQRRVRAGACAHRHSDRRSARTQRRRDVLHFALPTHLSPHERHRDRNGGEHTRPPRLQRDGHRDRGRRAYPRAVIVVVIVAAVLVVVGVGALLSYNRFVRQRQLIDNAWSNVDTELKRRYDLIPNLVATVEGYAAHERATLEAVVQARTAAITATGAADQAARENLLVDALRQLLALREAYPDLKASTQFLELQRQLTVTEDRIQAARRFYNANVRDYNTRVDTFPSMVIASLGSFA